MRIQRAPVIEAVAKVFDAGSTKPLMFVHLKAMEAKFESVDSTFGKAKFIRHMLESMDDSEVLAFSRKCLARFDGNKEAEGQLSELNGLLRIQDNRQLKLYFSGVGKPDIVVVDLTRGILKVNDLHGCIEMSIDQSEYLSWRKLFNILKRDYPDINVLLLKMRSSIPIESPQARKFFDIYIDNTLRKKLYDTPALIPELWLHYDPMTLKFRSGIKALESQRCDFYVKFSEKEVIIEIDGIQHYSINGKVNKKGYGDQCAWDRQCVLAGYEIYRFGTAEFDGENCEDNISSFIEELLKKYPLV